MYFKRVINFIHADSYCKRQKRHRTKNPSKSVKTITKKTMKFLRDMEDTMFKAKGVGIAAPQVGVNERIFLALLDQERVVAMVNPEIISYSVGETIEMEEGCLSLPGKWANTPRYKEVTLQYLDEMGHEKNHEINRI
ncbi:peptide deformylase [Candidatus Peregrinibacteria bacterium]|nr:MAG: peptide deformylase [Candidatus Peregrinibacteria bacterium]